MLTSPVNDIAPSERGLTANPEDEPRLNALRLRACAAGKLKTQSRVKERKGGRNRENGRCTEPLLELQRPR